MADILIRGMEMPKTCVQCDLKIYDPEKRWDENGIEQIGAWVCKRTGEVIWNTQRGEDCPLVPLPEGHGRLGDLDSLQEEFKKSHDGKRLMLIDTAPTIVPAEGELRNDS